MPPPIRFVENGRGARIAYWTLGEGPPVVLVLPLGLSDVRAEWEVAALRTWYERLSKQFTVIRFDPAGWGSSSAGDDVHSARLWGRDLLAVLDACGCSQVSVFSSLHGSLIAIPFAVDYPERVERLVMDRPYVRASDLLREPLVQAIQAAADIDPYVGDLAASAA